MYQNENLSVRASGNSCKLPSKARMVDPIVTAGKPLQKDARTLLNKIAELGFAVIGLQYDGAIQKWHTCKGRNRSIQPILVPNMFS
jgi:hypothetical protein